MAKTIEKNKKKYLEYVQKKLKKYKVDDPSKVPNKHKRKFYKELDKGWESKEEKAKKKADVTRVLTAFLQKESNLEGFVKDWKRALEKIVKGILSGLASNNSKGVKAQVALLRKSCDDLDDLVEDFGSKVSRDKNASWTQKIMTHKNMNKIKNLIIDMKEDILGDEPNESDEDNFIRDFAKTIDPLSADTKKIAPKQPPKGWWSKMHTKIKKENPKYDKATLDKIIGNIWYNQMKGPKKKEIMEEFEG